MSCCTQKTAYGMRISDWSSYVCSSDLGVAVIAINRSILRPHRPLRITQAHDGPVGYALHRAGLGKAQDDVCFFGVRFVRRDDEADRSEEHTSELQSLMRISYAVFCLKKKKKINNIYI